MADLCHQCNGRGWGLDYKRRRVPCPSCLGFRTEEPPVRHDVSIDSQFIEDNNCTVRCSCGWEMSGVSDSEATTVAVSHQQRAAKDGTGGDRG